MNNGYSNVKNALLLTAVSLLCACGSGGGSAPTANASTPTALHSSSTNSSVISSSAISSSAISRSSRPAFTGTLNGEVEAPSQAYKASPVTLTRLNRTQYNNTVKDLLGTVQTPADDFPEDDFGNGFNNIGEALSVSGLHLEQYHAAAEALANEVVNPDVTQNITILTAPFYRDYQHIYGDYVSFWDNSEITVTFNAPSAGHYAITIDAMEYHEGTDFVAGYVSINQQKILDVAVSGTFENPQYIRLVAPLKQGINQLSMGFTNTHDVASNKYRGLGVKSFTVQGPTANPKSQQFACQSNEGERTCAERVITVFATKAWRRPIETNEQVSLLALYDTTLNAGGSHTEAMRTLVTAALLSPFFTYRPEIDPNLNGTEPRPLNGYELASRLSYFLWSSMPDDELFLKAKDGTLLDDTALSAEIDRMLASPKAKTLIENFAVQWLKFDKITQATPNPKHFPSFNSALVESMRTETRLFLQELISSNAPIASLFTANFTYLDERLAKHYGVSGNFDASFQRHEWQGDRQGILGQASILTATSHPSSTSPVKRGVWVLENLLCQEPPPPPPGVENLTEQEDISKLSTRERFAKHSQAGSSCMACHTLMDPIGFGLESYNPIGQWRDMDGSNTVNATGTLPGNISFDGPWELGQLLATSPRLPLCVAEHVFTYALGRGVEAFTYGQQGHDYALVYDVYQQTKAAGNRFTDIIKAVALSPAFRQRIPATFTTTTAVAEGK